MNRLQLLNHALTLVKQCPHSHHRHADCYLEYIRKGKDDKEMIQYINEMTNKQLERLLSHHDVCPFNK